MIGATLFDMPSPRPMQSQRTPTKRRVAQALGLALVIGGLGISASSADPDPDRVPNQEDLPTYPQSGQWVPLRAAGLNYADRAKQWIRLPSMLTSAFNRSAANLFDNQCNPGAGLYPYTKRTARSASVHFKSPSGASDSYGYVGPFTVRTVAFGSIPVEAKIQLQQLRDEQNKSIGLEFRSVEGDLCPSANPHGNYPTFHVGNVRIEGELKVAVASLKVDGVDLELRNTCRTAEPSSIKLTAPEYFSVKVGPGNIFKYYLETGPGATPLPDNQTPVAANVLTTPVFQPVSGGLLTGNVAIGPFAGCLTTRGEDVSRLLTATVSGDNNAVMTRSEGINPDASALPPGTPFPPLPIPTSAP